MKSHLKFGTSKKLINLRMKIKRNSDIKGNEITINRRKHLNREIRVESLH